MNIKTMKMMCSDGVVRGFHVDPTTGTLEITTYPHSKIHEGEAFSIHHYEVDFDKTSEIGVLFTTPDTAEWIHIVPLVDCGTAALFEILRGPTLDTGNYPTTFYTPRNRNENSDNVSPILSVRAVPVANRASLKEKADTTPITGDGVVLHAEIVGTAKKGSSTGMRDTDEYVLLRNTTYYFRLKGLTNGTDSSVATMELTFYLKTNNG